MSEHHTHPHTGWTSPNYQPPAPPQPKRPFGALALIIGIIAVATTEFVPVIAFAIPGSLGILAVLVGVLVTTVNDEGVGVAAVIGVMAGGLACLLAADAYDQYQTIMGSFGGGY